MKYEANLSFFSVVVGGDKSIKAFPRTVPFVDTPYLVQFIILNVILLSLFFSGKATTQLRCVGDIFSQICLAFSRLATWSVISTSCVFSQPFFARTSLHLTHLLSLTIHFASDFCQYLVCSGFILRCVRLFSRIASSDSSS